MADHLEEDDTKRRFKALVVSSAQVQEMEERYTFSDRFQPLTDPTDPTKVRTLEELVECLKAHPEIELEARVIAVSTKGEKPEFVKMNRVQFLEHVQDQRPEKQNRMREAIKSHGVRMRENGDVFGTSDGNFGNGIVGGPDFVPLLGGPFFKQLYYADYMRMHSQCFYALHHDPMAKRVCQTMRDFTLGREWKVEFEDTRCQAWWDAFCEVNDFYELMNSFGLEISAYGEDFFWKLPNNDTKIGYQDLPGQEPKKGLIPRIRLVDPSVFWDIITFPEDITRVLYYQWIAPTQYQYYTGHDAGQPVGITKFVYQQIPADQIFHYKVNSVSNEKRGRSDLFPVLGYLKRLRDTVNYAIIGMQKSAAWAIDTEVDGAQEDLDAYVQSQQQIGTIAPAGSEFIHSAKVKRTYLSNAVGAGGGKNEAFEWCMNMIAAGTGIPIQYFGIHTGQSSTRATAVVSTEPVVKLFESRQNVYKRVINDIAKWAASFVQGADNKRFRIIFPELVVQDRSAKLQDLALAQMEGWITVQRAAETAAKELSILDFNYDLEKGKIQKEQTDAMSPLTAPPALPQAPKPPGGAKPDFSKPASSDGSPTGIDSQDKRSLDQSGGA